MALDPNLYADLAFRGILKQVTDPGIEAELKSGPVTLYAGFDPTSDSLHVGSLLPLLTLKRFQLAGHRPIAVVGGATGMIGDPSGKSAERSLLGEEQLAHNLKGISQVISRFLELEGPSAARVMNNGDWFKGVSYIDFLRDTGKHFTINHMMAKESVRARLEDREHGISYTEFSYMLLQAYDFHVLHKRENCRLQIGGSDQWGNITAGIELIRRMKASENVTEGTPEARVAEAFGITHPLVSKADGTKFGKTEQGTVWLDPKRTSPYQFYQFFVQAADADIMNFVRFFSFFPHEKILALEASVQSAPEKREAQIALAREVTALVHGPAELERAEKASQALFGDSIRDLDERTLLDVLGGAPSTTLPRTQLEGGGLPLIDALVSTALCASKGAARKDVTAGGVYVNNARIQDPAAALKGVDLIAGDYVVLRKGKKTYHLVKFG